MEVLESTECYGYPMSITIWTTGSYDPSSDPYWIVFSDCLVCITMTYPTKAAIEYNLRNWSQATEALTDMPPRSEEELDHVTLHNQALMHMDNDPASGFQKLQFLLQQDTFPKETFANLLLLYIKYDYFDLAADVLAENTELGYKHLSQYFYDFLESVIIRQTAPEEAYRYSCSDFHGAVLSSGIMSCHP